MELGDMGTIMLRDEEYYYRHNKKLITYLYTKYKDAFFSDFKNEDDLFINSEKDDCTSLISFRNLKYEIKKKIAKLLFDQLAKGLLFLHNSLISHRDLKPDNIVFSSKEDNCKIIDFSISVYFNNSIDSK